MKKPLAFASVALAGILSLTGVNAVNAQAAPAKVTTHGAAPKQTSAVRTAAAPAGSAPSLRSRRNLTDPYPPWLIYRNVITRLCIDDSLQAGLRDHACNGTDWQLWQANPPLPGAGEFALENQHTLRCIDDSFAYGLRAYTCNRQNYQLWYDTNDGALANAATGRCIDDSTQAGLRAHACNQTDWQHFTDY